MVEPKTLRRMSQFTRRPLIPAARTCAILRRVFSSCGGYSPSASGCTHSVSPSVGSKARILRILRGRFHFLHHSRDKIMDDRSVNFGDFEMTFLLPPSFQGEDRGRCH